MNTQNVTIIEVTEIPIELHKLIKYSTLAQSGGEAKSFISQGLVKVNGNVETQKRKKIVTGDVVEFDGRKIGVVLKNNPSIS